MSLQKKLSYFIFLSLIANFSPLFSSLAFFSSPPYKKKGKSLTHFKKKDIERVLQETLLREERYAIFFSPSNRNSSSLTLSLLDLPLTLAHELGHASQQSICSPNNTHISAFSTFTDEGLFFEGRIVTNIASENSTKNENILKKMFCLKMGGLLSEISFYFSPDGELRPLLKPFLKGLEKYFEPAQRDLEEAAEYLTELNQHIKSRKNTLRWAKKEISKMCNTFIKKNMGLRALYIFIKETKVIYNDTLKKHPYCTPKIQNFFRKFEEIFPFLQNHDANKTVTKKNTYAEILSLFYLTNYSYIIPQVFYLAPSAIENAFSLSLEDIEKEKNIFSICPFTEFLWKALNTNSQSPLLSLPKNINALSHKYIHGIIFSIVKDALNLALVKKDLPALTVEYIHLLKENKSFLESITTHFSSSWIFRYKNSPLLKEALLLLEKKINSIHKNSSNSPKPFLSLLSLYPSLIQYEMEHSLTLLKFLKTTVML